MGHHSAFVSRWSDVLSLSGGKRTSESYLRGDIWILGKREKKLLTAPNTHIPFHVIYLFSVYGTAEGGDN